MSKAYIIGTGPGDEELLTLKAVRALENCTAVLYDRLVSSNVLNYLKDDCIVYYCGKEPGAHSKTQEEINDLMVKLLDEGHTVGRIKGGDPYVFGRGGEEVLKAVENNHEFEVIPAVTSPIAVLSYAGIPITHRGIAQSFHIVTGKSAKDLNVNFEALAKENGTLVFMMGLSNLSLIKEKLILNGKSEDTACAVVMRGTTAKQKAVLGTLKDIEEKVEKAALQSPCIIVIGEVATLREKLNWYEKKPLFGANICITRTKEQATELKFKLKDLGAEVTEINSIKIEGTPKNIKPFVDKLKDYDHIIFTSVNGVNYFFDALIKEKYDIRNIKAKFSVIGKATDKALISRGIVPFLVARSFVSEGLFEDLKSKLKEGEKVLLPVSSMGRDFLEKSISEMGLLVDRVNVYDTLCGECKNVNAFEPVDMVLYTSPSTVQNMIKIIGLDKLKEKVSVAMGPKTNEELIKNGIVDAKVCKMHHGNGFLKEVESLYNEIKDER
ncbi:MAG: uroporphyrinogen-III C-methyltransferase [Sarcina sp.]